MNTKNTIEVVVALTSPMHVAYPGNYKDGLSRTVTQAVNKGGQKHSLPYYPANGFRGGLRRVIADLICDNLAKTEGAISGDLYNGLHCGASSGSPDQTAKSIEEIIRARSHVYMGLFGGGARTHESMYAVSDMVPILDVTIQAGMVPETYRDYCPPSQKGGDGVAREFEPFMLIDKRHFVRVDDLYRVADPEGISRTVANPIETVTQHQEKVGINKEARKADQESDSPSKETKTVKEDVANIQEIQTIAAGTAMYFRIDLKSDATEAQAGAMLLGVIGLLKENNFGCMGRWGFGRVKLLDIAMTFGGEDKRGTFSYRDDLLLPSGMLDLTVRAQEEVAAVRIADVANFFKDFSADKKAEDKKKKAGKAAGNVAAADA